MLSFCFGEQTITSCCKGIIRPTRFVLQNNIPAQTFSPLNISSTTLVAPNPFLMQTRLLAQAVEQSISLKRMTLGPLKKTTGRLDWTSVSLLFSSLSHHRCFLVVSDKFGGQNDCFDGLVSCSLGQLYIVVKDYGLWSQADLS